GVVRRTAQAALALLAATLYAGVAGDDLPLTGTSASRLDITPQASVGEIADVMWEAALRDPILLLGAGALGLAAAILPLARRRSRYGILVVGAALVAGSLAVGVGIAATLLAALVWAFAAAVAAGTRR
ncbi:MAG: hypothetical protein ACR2M2_00795, partial [Gaiellaceae bacterium]